jgi:arsenate reductase (glutaredoxin)
MAHIVFYEKRGCLNNTRQKEWLTAAGHYVEAVNILEHGWTEETLKPFFGNKPVAEWFNPTAPAIKSGELNPDGFSGESAIKAMIGQPILIKRPLMTIDGTHNLQGFDKDALHDMIGLTALAGKEDMVDALSQIDLAVCPRLDSGVSCDDIAKKKAVIPSLGPLIELIEKMGLEVTYAYEDLVFVSHTAFMFQFIEATTIALYFNTDCNENDALRLQRQILALAAKSDLALIRKGTFSIIEKEGEENLELKFFDEA